MRQKIQQQGQFVDPHPICSEKLRFKGEICNYERSGNSLLKKHLLKSHSYSGEWLRKIWIISAKHLHSCCGLEGRNLLFVIEQGWYLFRELICETNYKLHIGPKLITTTINKERTENLQFWLEHGRCLNKSWNFDL